MDGIDPIAMLMLGSSNIVGKSEMVEAGVVPLPEQYELAPGAKVLVTSSTAGIDADLVIGQILDPADWVEAFPDYKTRMESQPERVLLSYFSYEDRESELGWFARMKMIRITEEQYAEALTWQENGFPDKVPQWMNDVYVTYVDKLAANSPTRVPKPPTCPECGERQISLHIERTIIYKADAGEVLHQETKKPYYVPTEEPEPESTHEAHLHCLNCNAIGELEEDEWYTSTPE